MYYKQNDKILTKFLKMLNIKIIKTTDSFFVFNDISKSDRIPEHCYILYLKESSQKRDVLGRKADKGSGNISHQ